LLPDAENGPVDHPDVQRMFGKFGGGGYKPKPAAFSGGLH
jgi:heat shock protein HspQ